MTLQKQLEYVHAEVLVDTEWVEHPKASIREVNYDPGTRIEMKKEIIKKTSTVLFAIVTLTALFVVTMLTASQHVSAAVVVHHKVAVHHKTHNASEGSGTGERPAAVSSSPVIGGMIVDGY